MAASNTEFVYQLHIVTLNTEAPAEINKNPEVKTSTLKDASQAQAILRKAAGHALDTYNPANNDRVESIQYDGNGFEIHYLNDDGQKCIQTGSIQNCKLN